MGFCEEEIKLIDEALFFQSILLDKVDALNDLQHMFPIELDILFLLSTQP